MELAIGRESDHIRPQLNPDNELQPSRPEGGIGIFDFAVSVIF